MTILQQPPAQAPSPETFRALIAGSLATDALTDLLPELRVVGLAVERVHFPGAKPVQFQIRVQGQAGQSRLLIAEWLGQNAGEVAISEAASLAKVRRGQATRKGETAIAAVQPHGLVLRRPGFDAKLPGLRLLHDPVWAKERLSQLGLDPAASIRLVAHRLGKRAVLRIDGAEGTLYARLRPVTSGSGRTSYEQHMALWAALPPGTSLSVPRPRGFDDEIGLALFDNLPGGSPVFQGVQGFVACDIVLRAIGALQGLRINAPPHAPDDEMALVRVWADRTAEIFPALASKLEAPLRRWQEDMGRLSAVPPVPCHRDLHEGQILLMPGRCGLLDFDTLRLADPALDVGNLQAHLVLAGLRDGRSRQAFVTALENGLPKLSLWRIGVWRRAALLRLAMIYAFSSEPPAVIDGLVREAA
jgi:hypothetical protein